MFRLKPSTFVCLFLSLCLMFCFANIAAAKTIKVKYSDKDPLGGMRTDFLKNVWHPEIEKQTGGKLKIQAFFGGSLLNSKEILKGIGDNVVQLGFLYPGHYPGQLSAFTIYKLFPMGPSKFENMAWLYRKVMEEIPEFSEGLKQANQKVLLFYSRSARRLYRKKSDSELEQHQRRQMARRRQMGSALSGKCRCRAGIGSLGRCLYGLADRKPSTAALPTTTDCI